MIEGRHPSQTGQRFLEQLQPFRAKLRREDGHPGNVAARPPQTGDEPGADRIVRDHHNWDGAGGVLGQLHERLPPGQEHVHREPDQLSHGLGELFGLDPSELEAHVLALDVPQLAQPLPEGLKTGRRQRTNANQPDPVDFRWRQRLGGERGHEATKGKGNEKHDGTALHGGVLGHHLEHVTCEGACARV